VSSRVLVCLGAAVVIAAVALAVAEIGLAVARSHRNPGDVLHSADQAAGAWVGGAVGIVLGTAVFAVRVRSAGVLWVAGVGALAAALASLAVVASGSAVSPAFLVPALAVAAICGVLGWGSGHAVLVAVGKEG
jgi:hypothetical protein